VRYVPEPLVPVVSIATLRTLLGDPSLRFWLVHATDAHPFAAGHIPGSLARPAVALLRRLAEEVPIVVYGEDEHASAASALATELRDLDVDVAWFTGGLAAWTAAGLPLERSG
jgi:rhodanese-related sulfurtransferase